MFGRRYGLQVGAETTINIRGEVWVVWVSGQWQRVGSKSDAGKVRQRIFKGCVG